MPLPEFRLKVDRVTFSVALPERPSLKMPPPALPPELWKNVQLVIVSVAVPPGAEVVNAAPLCAR
jgi:hypothetical protein